MAVKIKFSFSILLFIEAQKPAVQELAFHGLQQRQGWRIVVDQFSDTAALRLREVLLLESQATVMNGAALEIQLAKAFYHSAIRKHIL